MNALVVLYLAILFAVAVRDLSRRAERRQPRIRYR
jgi:hypothetical protein